MQQKNANAELNLTDGSDLHWFSPVLQTLRSVSLAQFGFTTVFLWQLVIWLVPTDPSFAVVALPVGWIVVTFALLVFFCWLLPHTSTRYRWLAGTIPSAALIALGAALSLVGTSSESTAGLIFLGAALGLVFSSRRYSAASTPDRWSRIVQADRRVFAMLNLVQSLVLLVIAFLLARLVTAKTLGPVVDILRWCLLVLAFVLLAWCCVRFHRPLIEILIEPWLSILYRMRSAGPGLALLPDFGPCLVIANHACWTDPIFLGKLLPRPIKPIMTQRFFEIWFLKPLLKYVFRVIVVPETPLRREAPELQLAIAALDRGECVIIFPEGFLRRKEEQPLKRFGQGVWHILASRPDTPVTACWIEGGWGSKFSYKDGPPGSKTKKMDIRRSIVVAFAEPEILPPEVLANTMHTRIHLMNAVSKARRHLNLPELPPFEIPHSEDF